MPGSIDEQPVEASRCKNMFDAPVDGMLYTFRPRVIQILAPTSTGCYVRD
ncbi:MAG: hypothetical protein K2N96_05755 [Muribaculaceae bacterium]|nr:hypothetical protein [Muribaculaceae bacterium]